MRFQQNSRSSSSERCHSRVPRKRTMYLGSCHTETFHDPNFLWVREGFYRLVFEKGCMVRKVRNDSSADDFQASHSTEGSVRSKRTDERLHHLPNNGVCPLVLQEMGLGRGFHKCRTRSHKVKLCNEMVNPKQDWQVLSDTIQKQVPRNNPHTTLVPPLLLKSSLHTKVINCNHPPTQLHSSRFIPPLPQETGNTSLRSS